MARRKTIEDAQILAVARSLFLAEGFAASTRRIAKQAGISEAVIFQRFPTKVDLFFAAMVLPEMDLDRIFQPMPESDPVAVGLEKICLGILNYFREVIPIFIPLLSHPEFDFKTSLDRHAQVPEAQMREKLVGFLKAEASRGRVNLINFDSVATLLIATLHNFALFENMGAGTQAQTNQLLTETLLVLWQGLAPDRS